MKSPYIYLIGWSQLDRWYIGVRHANNCSPSELWSSYFTSSAYVTAFRYVHGEPDVFLTTKVSDKHAALRMEEAVQFYFDAVKDERYLNRNRGGSKFVAPAYVPNPMKGKKLPAEWAAKVRDRLDNPSYRQKFKAAHNTPEAKANHAAANKPFTAESRAKGLETRKRKKEAGWVNPRKGSSWTEEQRQKTLDRNASPETKARRSAAMRKRHADRKAREAALSSAVACDAPTQRGC